MSDVDQTTLADLCEDAADRAAGGVGEVDCAIAAKIAEHGDVILLDCRRPEELVEEGILPGARHCVLDDIPAKGAATLFPDGPADDDKETPILCYCRSGVRSLSAVKALQALGFTCCASLAGGILGWKSSGGPTTRP